MRKLLLGLVFSFLFAITGFAQEYNSAAGARFGLPLSASYKTFLSEHHAAEGIAGIYSNFGVDYFTVGAAYHIHNDIENEAFRNLTWFYGPGAAIFLGDVNYIGAQFYIGVSLTLDEVPLNLSIDWVPTFEFTSQSRLGAGYGALAARYILNR